MKVTILLGNDQADLRHLIEQFKNSSMTESDSSQLQEIGQQIRRQIRIHSQMASEVFYPALAVTPSDQAVPTAVTAENRCEVVKKLFLELSRMQSSDADFEVKVDSVIAEIGRHVAMQEDELIHEAQKAFLEYRFENHDMEPDIRFAFKMIAVI
jgi:hypothetical protein